MKSVMLIFGTRPEAIKMAPVVREMLRPDSGLKPCVTVTAQHRELLDQVLKVLEIEPDLDLDLMTQEQGLAQFTAKALVSVTAAVGEVKPDLILVHGDTSTSLAGALAGYYNQIPVAHVEAGLRTDDMYSPWPEEANRRLVGVLSSLHFAPTEWSRDNLLREAVPDAAVHVTGNTVVDSLLWVRDVLLERPGSRVELQQRFPFVDPGQQMVLMTNHRRENFGDGMEQVYLGVRELAATHPLTAFVFPIHLNPSARRPAERILGDLDNVFLIEPVEYVDFVYLMERAHLIITDSGGVQEEAPSLGTPVLVTRKTTERPEAVNAGTAILVGTDRAELVRRASRLLEDPVEHALHAGTANPYGDGQAAKRIVTAIQAHLGVNP